MSVRRRNSNFAELRTYVAVRSDGVREEHQNICGGKKPLLLTLIEGLSLRIRLSLDATAVHTVP